MATYKGDMTEVEIGLGLMKLNDVLVNGNGKLLIQITHTSASNMSYRYKVTLAHYGTTVWASNDAIQLENLTYLLASAWKENYYSGAFNELKGNGVGTDRYFLAAYNIGLTLKKYGYITDAYQIASRGTKYIEI